MKNLFYIYLIFNYAFLYDLNTQHNFVAWISEIKGPNASIIRSGSNSWNSLSEGDTLITGDKIKTESNTTVVIFQKPCHRFKLTENSTWIATESTEINSRFSNWWNFFASFLSAYKKPTDRSETGARKSLNSHTIILPFDGGIITKTPSFAWTTSKTCDRAQLWLVEVFSGKVIWDTVLTDTFIFYPKSAAELKYNTDYKLEIWNLCTNSRDDWVDFYLPPKNEIDEIITATEDITKYYVTEDTTDIMMYLLLAAYYQKQEIFTEAYLKLIEAFKLRSTSPEIAKMLLKLYHRQGLYEIEENLLKSTKSFLNQK